MRGRRRAVATGARAILVSEGRQALAVKVEKSCKSRS